MSILVGQFHIHVEWTDLSALCHTSAPRSVTPLSAIGTNLSPTCTKRIVLSTCDLRPISLKDNLAILYSWVSHLFCIHHYTISITTETITCRETFAAFNWRNFPPVARTDNSHITGMLITIVSGDTCANMHVWVPEISSYYTEPQWQRWRSWLIWCCNPFLERLVWCIKKSVNIGEYFSLATSQTSRWRSV